MNSSEKATVASCLSCGNELCAGKVSLFSKLKQGQLHQLISLIERTSYKKGETVMGSGDLFDRLYIVNSGALKASTFNAEGKEQILYLLNEGDSIGELALLKVDRAPYDLIATQASLLCTIPKASFDLFLEAHPEVVFSILESAYDKITSLERLVGIVASNDADTRLKYLLQQLIRQSGRQTLEGTVIQLQLTREDMANFVGVTRETVSRKLHELVENGVLEILDSKRIRILDQGYFE